MLRCCVVQHDHVDDVNDGFAFCSFLSFTESKKCTEPVPKAMRIQIFQSKCIRDRRMRNLSLRVCDNEGFAWTLWFLLQFFLRFCCWLLLSWSWANLHLFRLFCALLIFNRFHQQNGREGYSKWVCVRSCDQICRQHYMNTSHYS